MDFIEKYEGTENESNGIIGHFGLGFYSAFMVSDQVEVISRSWDGSPAIGWVCNQDGEYEILPEVTRQERGTDVIMHLSEDEREYLTEHKLREVLDKYCAFVPVDIYLEIIKENGEENKNEEKDAEKEAPKPINDTHPLWLKSSGDCTEEEYKAFYSKVFNDYREPLFHIHINADYPLNFKGILYFPKLNANVDGLDGQIKLYYNQVFVSDSIKELLPDYLLMLRGVIDCPELPLNVSRSYMQNSAYARKLAAHITKKVADKINSMFNTAREDFEKLWPDIKLFVEFACLRDQKFYERVKNSLLLPITDGSYMTVSEYLEEAKDKHENQIYYTDDKTSKAQYIKLFEDEGIKIVLFDSFIDNQFINALESDGKVKFARVDSELADVLRGEGDSYENKELADAFAKLGGEKMTVKFENLRDAKTPAVLSISEQSRRFGDMMKVYSSQNGGEVPAFAEEQTLILNSNCPLIRKLGEKQPDEKLVRHIYTLALLAQRSLSADELTSFLADSYDLIEDNL